MNFDKLDATPRSSVAGSPAPEVGTPIPGVSTPALNNVGAAGAPLAAIPTGPTPLEQAEERDKTVPTAALDKAILESITQAARGDEKKVKDYLAGIMIVGGGSLTPGLNHFLEERYEHQPPFLS